MAKVFIGVGHGGSDPGAVANGLREEDLNLVTALACNEELVRHGVVTLMSRTTDEEDTLKQEIAECNAFGPDLALDVHHNAGGGDGVEVFHSINGGKGKELAQAIIDEIVALGQNSRGIKTKKNASGLDWYGFIRQTKAPAVIVEVAFLDSKDHEFVDTEEEQKRNGIAIAKGALKVLGIEWKPAEKKQIVLGEYDTLREADDDLGAIFEKIASIELCAADLRARMGKAEVVG